MELHTFFNSSASYRVRIALALKAQSYDTIPINIRTGAQKQKDFLALSPAGLVPVLVDGDMRLSQSLAIIDHLDQMYPETSLVPDCGPERRLVLEIANLVACDIHPLNNLRVLKFLTHDLALGEEKKTTWYSHWITEGFDALETLLPDHDGWCVGDAPTLADCCLVPQVANAHRMKIDLTAWPRIRRIYSFASSHPAFKDAAPERQADFVAS